MLYNVYITLIISSIIIDNMQSAKEKKQEFLRAEILEPGYDPEQFLAYITSQGYSSDIDELTQKQLEMIVDRFKKTKLTGSPQKSPSHKQVEFEPDAIIN